MDLSRKNQDNPLSHPPRKRFVQNFLLGAFHCGDRFLMTCRPEFKEPRWPLLADLSRRRAARVNPISRVFALCVSEMQLGSSTPIYSA